MRSGIGSVFLHGSRQGRWSKIATAILEGGRLHNRLGDCVERCVHLHRMGYVEADRSSANDIAAIVGGALPRIFQLLCDEIKHHIPSCTAVVWEKRHSPTHKAAKACIHRYQALRLVLKPGGMLAPSHLLTHLREGADVRKFAEPSDDLHHIACLSSVRACW
jgi:hypothetical protein